MVLRPKKDPAYDPERGYWYGYHYYSVLKVQSLLYHAVTAAEKDSKRKEKKRKVKQNKIKQDDRGYNQLGHQVTGHDNPIWMWTRTQHELVGQNTAIYGLAATLGKRETHVLTLDYLFGRGIRGLSNLLDLKKSKAKGHRARNWPVSTLTV